MGIQMKLYDTVKLTEKFAEFDVGTAGVIIELYDNKICYLEIFDDGDTIGVIYDVPVSILKKVED